MTKIKIQPIVVNEYNCIISTSDIIDAAEILGITIQTHEIGEISLDEYITIFYSNKTDAKSLIKEYEKKRKDWEKQEEERGKTCHACGRPK